VKEASPVDIAWVNIGLATGCLFAGLLHLRLALSRPAEHLPHAAMGVGMAAMFVPTADPFPRAAWLALFGVIAVGAAVSMLRARSFIGVSAGHHLVGAVVMAFMLLTHVHSASAAAADPQGGGHHGGAGGGGLALLVSVFALAFAAWFAADVARILGAGRVDDAQPVASVDRSTAIESSRVTLVAAPTGLPGLVRPARVLMSAAMAVMLVAIA
jgi:hypothetical protein